VLCQDLRISASRGLERPSQTEMVILQCGRRQSRQDGFANSVVKCLGLVLLCWSLLSLLNTIDCNRCVKPSCNQ
jgi:hypothetical protein